MLRLFLLLSKGSEYCDAEIIAPVPTVKVDKSRAFHYRSRKIVFIDSPSLFVKCLNEVLCDFIDYDKFILPRLMEVVLANFSLKFSGFFIRNQKPSNCCNWLFT